MSSCLKEIYDYDLVKICSKCGIISFKINFHKNRLTKDGLVSQCKSCVIQKQKQYDIENRDKTKNHGSDNKGKRNEYYKNRREKDLDIKLAHNIRVRTNKVFKSQNVRKTNKTFDLLECSHSFFQSRVIHQLYGTMTLENYGSVWQIDHWLAIESFNLLDEKEMRRCFNWINLKLMYVKDNIIKGDEIDMRLYFLQEIKSNCFLKINVEEG